MITDFLTLLAGAINDEEWNPPVTAEVAYRTRVTRSQLTGQRAWITPAGFDAELLARGVKRISYTAGIVFQAPIDQEGDIDAALASIEAIERFLLGRTIAGRWAITKVTRQAPFNLETLESVEVLTVVSQVTAQDCWGAT